MKSLLLSVAASLLAIGRIFAHVPVAKQNFGVRNGSVRGWTDGGVRADVAENMLAEKLRLSGNTGSIGLAAGNGSMIKDCLAIGNGTGNTLRSCTASANTGGGILCGFGCTVTTAEPWANFEY
jgi:hypothetical protein